MRDASLVPPKQSVLSILVRLTHAMQLTFMYIKTDLGQPWERQHSSTASPHLLPYCRCYCQVEHGPCQASECRRDCEGQCQEACQWGTTGRPCQGRPPGCCNHGCSRQKRTGRGAEPAACSEHWPVIRAGQRAANRAGWSATCRCALVQFLFACSSLAFYLLDVTQA